MALETNFTDADHLFIGCDVHLIIGGGNGFHILADPGGVGAAVIDVSSFALELDVRNAIADASAIFTLTSGGGLSVTGTYDASQLTNTQGVDCYFSASNTTLLAPGSKAWALKRMDAGVKTIIAYGTFPWALAAVR